MTKSKKFKKEYAKELLDVARQDLEGAEILLASRLKRQEITLFHVQQAVEKSLKATLCWQEKPVPLVHSLAIILDRFDIQVPHESKLEELTQFATIRRYEEGIALFTPEEVQIAIDIAKDVLSFADSIVGKG